MFYQLLARLVFAVSPILFALAAWSNPAATSSGLAGSMPSLVKDFTVDRPFFFLIRENTSQEATTSGQTIFAGEIADPRSAADRD